ncbi:MAG: transposase [Candidatus Symbiodolus clandestinus]
MSSQQYTPEFKRRTLELLAESGKSVPQLAKELGISENTLYGQIGYRLYPTTPELCASVRVQAIKEENQ